MGNLWTSLVIHSHEDCKVKIAEEPNLPYPYRLTFGENELVIRGNLADFEDIAVGIQGEITRIKEEDYEEERKHAQGG